MLDTTLLATIKGKNKYSVCRVSCWWNVNQALGEDRILRFIDEQVEKWNMDDKKCQKRIMTNKQFNDVVGCYKHVFKKGDIKSLLHYGGKNRKYTHSGFLSDDEWKKYPKEIIN